jgi:hypothetical protein
LERILPGYFHYADTVDILSFTPHTVAALLARHQLTYRPRAWLGFLEPNCLKAAYYLALSQQRLRQQPGSALAALWRQLYRRQYLQYRRVRSSATATAPSGAT